MTSVQPDLAAAMLPLAQGAAVGAYGLCQLALTACSAHRWTLLLGRRVRPGAPLPPLPGAPPVVTVQLPVYNEPRVVERLVDAACALDWPADRLEIQLLDDSTDETPAIAAAAVARHRARGIDVRHVRRTARDGWKAGALAAGLAEARGELVAIFDADFVPPADFLQRMVPHFADPGVGMAQACWGHLNRDASTLTAAQAVLLDAHFRIEHAARAARGWFFNFNGTAGLWRRACIESAGGWSHDTLTEDLDLSVRAQLAGWRFVFDPAVVVPAELPSDMEAFKAQQRRWAKGAIQSARKLLPAIARSRRPLAVRLDAALLLLANAAFPLLLALGLLLLPVLLGRSVVPPAVVWAAQAAVLALGLVPVTLFLAAGQHAAGRRGLAVVRDVASALVLCAGLSLNNARAVLEGLGPAVGAWERTPKTGETGPARARRVAAPRRRGAGWGEAALAGYFAVLLAWAATCGHRQAAPFAAVLAAGCAWVAAGSRPGALTTSRVPPGRAAERPPSSARA